MTDTTAEAIQGHGGHGGGHGHDPVHAANPHLAHHFDTPKQQFEAGKLGIWLFLVTEILFFSGLFCAYTVYRVLDPDVFEWGHYHLDTNLGALNTSVLILSSLTAAWAVRNAQRKEQTALIINIVVTLLCAATFMVVKYMEYSHKIHDGLLPGAHFAPQTQVWELPFYHAKNGPPPEGLLEGNPAAIEAAKETITRGHPYYFEAPKNAHRFFAIYFCMTGLHGIHVIAGMIVWVWMLLKAMKRHFGPKYFGPVDFAALYWHLVDLVWIYLFPLLYLID
jgi:cytochrome c oxidase subunit III